MLDLTVGERAGDSGLLQRLTREVGLLRELGLWVKLDRYELADRVFYRVLAGREDGAGLPPETVEIVRASVALAVSETVLQVMEPAILGQIVKELRPAYLPAERERVVESARAIAHRLDSDPVSERSRVLERAVEQLSETPLLLVDGFVRFRLKEYCDELADCARQAIDDHEFQKEREEFISLLRDFVDGRPQGVREVHVLPSGDERFCLVDQSGSPVETSYLDEFTWGLVDDGQVDMEELLITTLVSLAPGKVVCHRPLETRDVPMVQDVFHDRLDYCPGCPLCQDRAAPTARPRTH